MYDAFMERLAEAVRGVVVGDPLDEATEMGPLISAGHLERVRGFVDGTPHLQGSCPEGKGYWFPPTVLTPRSPTGRSPRRSSAPWCRWSGSRTRRRPVRIANDTPYG
ncbi:hypothetical protein GCM10020220_096710 [Nonomuraea rubra]